MVTMKVATSEWIGAIWHLHVRIDENRWFIVLKRSMNHRCSRKITDFHQCYVASMMLHYSSSVFIDFHQWFLWFWTRWANGPQMCDLHSENPQKTLFSKIRFSLVNDWPMGFRCSWTLDLWSLPSETPTYLISDTKKLNKIASGHFHKKW